MASMDGLFSHAPSSEPVEAVAASVPAAGELQTARAAVPEELEQALEGFIEYLHLWWPLGIVSVAGPGSHVWWDEDGWREEAEDGTVHEWGHTLTWEWPSMASVQLELDEQVLHLEVSLREESRHCEVQLRATLPSRLPRHPGREEDDVPADLWRQVLGFYARFMGGRLLDED